jgi:hypothetical protein
VALRETIRQASGETLDLKAYEADMRHLIDTYIRADEARKISPFGDVGLLDWIASQGIDAAIARLPAGIRADRGAVAETIARPCPGWLARRPGQGAGRQATALRCGEGRRAGRAALPGGQGAGGILMGAALQAGEIRIEVVRKDIKNVHLSVHPPAGRVRISAPRHLSDDVLRAFAIGKLGWIRKQRAKIRDQSRETPRDYVDRETHYVWGERCLLRVVERAAPPTAEWCPGRLILSVRAGTGADRRAAIVDAWYRAELRAAVAPLAATWEPRLGVALKGLYVRRMCTRWGSCNPRARTIRLNTELAKKPRACLEYVLVHELVHLLEPSHNARFVALMDQHLPGWRERRALLNRLPLRHEEWER